VDLVVSPLLFLPLITMVFLVVVLLLEVGVFLPIGALPERPAILYSMILIHNLVWEISIQIFFIWNIIIMGDET